MFTNKVSPEVAYNRLQGVNLVQNVEANRVQLIFPGKPSADVRAELKARGFRWSPSEGAWQRHLNNAGIYQPATLMETDTALFERHMRINQLGVFLGMKAVVPLMERSGGGAIVNISSVAGLRGSPGAFAYSATKWAVRGMTKAAAIDLAPRGIRVNSIHPGTIDTPMLDVRTAEQNARRLEAVPMKRRGTPEEVADLALFLLSDESRYITGAEVAIDGGATL